MYAGVLESINFKFLVYVTYFSINFTLTCLKMIGYQKTKITLAHCLDFLLKSLKFEFINSDKKNKISLIIIKIIFQVNVIVQAQRLVCLTHHSRPAFADNVISAYNLLREKGINTLIFGR